MGWGARLTAARAGAIRELRAAIVGPDEAPPPALADPVVARVVQAAIAEQLRPAPGERVRISSHSPTVYTVEGHPRTDAITIRRADDKPRTKADVKAAKRARLRQRMLVRRLQRQQRIAHGDQWIELPDGAMEKRHG